ncbi:MAG TPA: rhamnogalacturonan acetylesterase [Draconibacterium sp.]|nr:rhamnogalacturonan acetylesterase [Draconibacterium sp.]
MQIGKINRYQLVVLLLLVTLFGCHTKQSIRIFSIGDSTMADKKPEVFPETGWGQVLPEYFDATVTIHNHAVNGRSSKSFIDEGRWQLVLDSLQPGDILFIQFGHNDQKEYDSTRYTTPFGTYTKNLEQFINEARQKDAEPILCTSIVRRKFGEDGKLIDTHGNYPVAMRQVAKKLNVPLVDLQKRTEKWVNGLGDEASKKMFVWVETSKNYPEGRKDNTHLSVEGAKNVAKLAMEECKRQKLDFSDRIYIKQ